MSSKQTIAALALLFVISTAVLLWWSRPHPQVADMSQPASYESREPQAARAAESQTIEQAWRWERFSKAELKPKNPPAGQPPFTVAGVHQALRTVELDANGMPVVDSRALSALQSAFADVSTRLTDADLQRLEEIIRAGLPGPGGEQVAGIVSNYYRYDIARRDIESQVPPPQDPESMQTHYESLVALRQQHLGADVARQLFAAEEAYARFTIESMRIQATPGVSDADKERMQAELRTRLAEGVLPDKPDAREREWQQRYARFAQQRQMILNAGLPERDQREQIEQLLATHFNDRERERARNYMPGDGSQL